MCRWKSPNPLSSLRPAGREERAKAANGNAATLASAVSAATAAPGATLTTRPGRAESGRASRLRPAHVGRERLRGASSAPTMWKGKEGRGKREEKGKEEEAPPQRGLPPSARRSGHFRPPPRASMTHFLPPAPLPHPRAGGAAAILPLSRCRSPGRGGCGRRSVFKGL